MIKEEIRSISLQRAAAFFREQEDVTEESANVFLFRSCRIVLNETKTRGVGILAAKRLHLRMEGEDTDVETIYHRFFVQFLSM